MTQAESLQLTVLDDFEYVDDTLDDAAWYDTYTIKAGTYAITIDGADAVITADATLTEEFRTTRLMSRNKAEARSVYEETTFAFRSDALDAVPGPLSVGGAYGWAAAEGSPTPSASVIASVVADLRAATAARRAVATASGLVGPEYAEALRAEAVEKAAVVARAQATA
ncbi:hypothetical protein GCM10025867_30760 [Frondihabitans sucicola]|uniref:Uncharacterized protein n=1 Tax=Frondihabitans sucicola TaxID=1268041 RepID=A0ABM8GQX7_9MICO|nr:hypothetical protein [Frondihabitans sucicola]BDZ50835.1 hypothetical protein GCM10025867_30760 [Frondihabitans sucicola]